MNRWKGRVAVVTGASAGIGNATCKALLREGLIVVGFARRKAKMEESMADVPEATDNFFPYECDVTNLESVTEAFQWIEQKFGLLHVLINNAGMVRLNTVVDVDIKDIHDVVSLNLMGVVYCCREGIKLMRKNDHEAHVININSIYGHRVHLVQGLYFNIYSATKHAITGLTETLQKELLGGKVKVTSLSPGCVRTDLFNETDFDQSLYQHFPALSPTDIADAIVFAISRPAHVQITELTIRPLGEAI
ncbi:hypothetical protein QAD02_006230 [Eretmocerus hayati]|uniref:Uncharacterized protein n=1 Tax=Eretmocerus hayati TaxID=131215 RepID=A0ACC2N0D5_9HYME|nr:hypothetical protein QAD02_006230 [Eretmocerus hayati]